MPTSAKVAWIMMGIKGEEHPDTQGTYLQDRLVGLLGRAKPSKPSDRHDGNMLK